MSRNEDVKNFLTRRRAAIDPAEYGFATRNRRVQGLRREEVAQLAAVSASWYTWLEQGRDIKISLPALRRIAQVLRLTPVERDYLEALVLGAKNSAVVPAELSQEIIAMVDALDPHPAFVRRSNMDIIYWNRASEEKIFDWSALEPQERNSLKLMFINSDYKRMIHDWEVAASHTLSAFRSNYAEAQDNAAFRPIIEDLNSRSPEFRRIWASHDVNIIGSGKKSFVAENNELKNYRYTSLTIEDNPGLHLIFYLEVKN